MPEEIAVLLRAGKALGVSVVEQRNSFDRNTVEVLIEAAYLGPVPAGEAYLLTTLVEQPDGTLRACYLTPNA